MGSNPHRRIEYAPDSGPRLDKLQSKLQRRQLFLLLPGDPCFDCHDHWVEGHQKDQTCQSARHGSDHRPIWYGNWFPCRRKTWIKWPGDTLHSRTEQITGYSEAIRYVFVFLNTWTHIVHFTGFMSVGDPLLLACLVHTKHDEVDQWNAGQSGAEFLTRRSRLPLRIWSVSRSSSIYVSSRFASSFYIHSYVTLQKWEKAGISLYHPP